MKIFKDSRSAKKIITISSIKLCFNFELYETDFGSENSY